MEDTYVTLANNTNVDISSKVATYCKHLFLFSQKYKMRKYVLFTLFLVIILPFVDNALLYLILNIFANIYRKLSLFKKQDLAKIEEK